MAIIIAFPGFSLVLLLAMHEVSIWISGFKLLGFCGPPRQTLELLWTTCNPPIPTTHTKNTIQFDSPWRSAQRDDGDVSCRGSILCPLCWSMGKYLADSFLKPRGVFSGSHEPPVVSEPRVGNHWYRSTDIILTPLTKTGNCWILFPHSPCQVLELCP